MSTLNVLLVQPQNHNKLGFQAFILPEPLGLETVAASLTSEHDVHILDMRLDPALRETLSLQEPDAVGVSASFTADVYSAYRVLDTVHDYNPHIRTFVGGHHATMCHNDFFGRADAVVLGEGELTSAELLHFWEQGWPLEEVDGIAFAHGDSWIQTKPRPLVKDLDDTPLPARGLVSKYLDHYFHGSRRPCAYVETSRGCPYRCRFCSVWKFYQGSYRARTPERVARELSQVQAPHVFFSDDNFLADASRAERIIEAIKEALISKRYIAQIRADSIVKHKDTLTRLAAAGLETVFVGFESVTQKGLDSLKKRASVSQNVDAMRILRELDINVMSSFIVDTDFEEQDFTSLKRFVKKMKLRQPVFAVLTPLPGTELHQERSGELTTNNYELFDLHHAVLPTALGLNRFYKEFARLYMSTYLNFFSLRGVVRWFRYRRKKRGRPLRDSLRQLWALMMLMRGTSARALVRHHYESAGKLLPDRIPNKREAE